MKKIILILVLLSSSLFAQNNHLIIDSTQKVYVEGYYHFGFPNSSKIEPVYTFDGKFILPIEVTTNECLIDARSKLLEVQSNCESQTITELPAVGQIVYKDSLYLYSDTLSTSNIIKCRQTHNRTIYPPSVTPALFSFHRVNSDTLSWIENEEVQKDWYRMYGGFKWKCLQSHMTLIGWEPPNLPALWNKVVVTQEWTYPVAYKVNDIVTYLNKTYRCIQAHTSNVSWTPTATLNVLWILNN